MRSLALWRAATLAGCFALPALFAMRYWWLVPPTGVAPALPFLALLLPLAFPFAGLLRARPYTHAWGGFVALFYLASGVVSSFDPGWSGWLGLAEALAALSMFLGCVFYARLAGRAERARAAG